MLLYTKSLSSTFLKLALQAFYQAKSITILALNLLTLVQLKGDVFFSVPKVIVLYSVPV